MVQRSGRLLGSIDTLAELSEVLLRPKFDRYLSQRDRIQWLVDFADTLSIVEISTRVRECHDPKDEVSGIGCVRERRPDSVRRSPSADNESMAEYPHHDSSKLHGDVGKPDD
jgi:hypothetical protein